MKKFDKNYKLLKEMYEDDYYPVFLVDKERAKPTRMLFKKSWMRWFVLSTICKRSLTKTTARLKRLLVTALA